MKRVPMQRLIDFGVSFMTRQGVPEDKAAHVATVVVETEAFRQSTHGVVQFPTISGALGGDIDPAAEPEIVREHPSTAVLDGHRCLANITMKTARDMACAKAREHSIGFVGVRNTGWIGALGMHVVSVAQDGLLCQAWAQTSACRDCAPFGGIEPRFSTNPIAIALPTAGDPIIADFSTATMSMGKAYALIHEGEKTEKPRFLDKKGYASSDPSAVKDGGTLMFIGGEMEGYKGYALSIFNEALTILAGGSANNPAAPSYQSFALLVLDPEAFAGRDYYLREMKRFMAHVKSSSPRPGSSGIRFPGERGFAALADCRANGVPLDDGKIDMLRGLAENHGLEPVA
jgi:LDH2 family malate/lactate/ureidoglycolate dehydrogenase